MDIYEYFLQVGLSRTFIHSVAIACRTLITSTKHTEHATIRTFRLHRLDCYAHPRLYAGRAALSGVNSHRLGIAWRSCRYSLSSYGVLVPSNQYRFMHLRMHTRCIAIVSRVFFSEFSKTVFHETFIYCIWRTRIGQLKKNHTIINHIKIFSLNYSHFKKI